MSQRAIATAVVLIVGLLALTACGPGQIRTQSYGYGGTYTSYGRD